MYTYSWHGEDSTVISDAKKTHKTAHKWVYRYSDRRENGRLEQQPEGHNPPVLCEPGWVV